MTRTKTTPEPKRPLYWLVILDQAVESGEFAIAAEAQKQLERLGVTVKYRGTRPATSEEFTHATA
jgi:hypothetical protein